MTKRAQTLTLVTADGCALCRWLGHEGSPAEVHHQRDGAGIAQKGSDESSIPLCPIHHRGAEGFHTLGKRAWEAKYIPQASLLEWDRESRVRP